MIDLLVKRLWGNCDPCDLIVADGRLVPPEEADNGNSASTTDAGSRLAAPGFVEPHLPLDKIRVNVSGALGEAIEIIWARKRVYSESEVTTRASRLIACSP
jgi:cytosine/adenosine deaminase-related metal-dependent hydrolase